jgi:Domain of Unknown Function with PDB structure (DUF3857)
MGTHHQNSATLQLHQQTPRLLALACLGIFGLTGYLRAADEVPLWLKDLPGVQLPPQPKKVNAVVLWHESTVTIDDTGRQMTSITWAVRILAREGRGHAAASVGYTTDSSKVKDLKAWLIRPSGEVKRYGKDQIVDIASVGNDVYNEHRARVISASDDVEPGATFGYQALLEDQGVFTQFPWYFQGSPAPTRLSQFNLKLPAGWKSESITFNHPKVEPKITGNQQTWELRDLPFIEEEPSRPSIFSLVPRLAVSVFPPAGSKAGRQSFADWSEVSQWLTQLGAGQDTSNPAIAAKVKELTAASQSEFERIQAIGRFAQDINYISVQIGSGRGGGYRPHAAADVFSKAYGDCKDKANLMRTMLREAGLTAFPLAIYSGDRDYVQPGWPSPHQFNHMIVAIRVGPETKAPAIVDSPAAGRLLIFDPTDSHTAVGDLPDHEQGSHALLIAGDAGRLLRMPHVSAESNRTERRIQATLAADGSFKATVQETSLGQAAATERRWFRDRSPDDYRKLIESWVTHGVRSSTVSKVSPKDDSRAGRFDLLVEFEAPQYGQLMQKRLLIFKPAPVSRREATFFVEPSRKYPIVLGANSFVETVNISLPSGFRVDELPETISLETNYGAYSTSCKVANGELVFTRSLTQRAATVPASEYEQVRHFFNQVGAADQVPVVLVKQ